ncbi:hypothetical protein BGP_0927 [Beggiatoa sp. PS]|nr:hypothetical protein BGP_0927 [Beggiatoa sp. PS]
MSLFSKNLKRALAQSGQSSKSVVLNRNGAQPKKRPLHHTTQGPFLCQPLTLAKIIKCWAFIGPLLY